MFGEIFGALSVVLLLLYGMNKLRTNTFVSLKRPSGHGRRFGHSASSQGYRQVPVPPGTLYHGTKMENALEIYNTGLWLVGHARPRAVWMTDNLKIARTYSGRKGGVVVVRVDPSVQLTSRGGGVYIYEIPDAKPKSEYFQVQGLHPVAVLDSSGNEVS